MMGSQSQQAQSTPALAVYPDSSDVPDLRPARSITMGDAAYFASRDTQTIYRAPIGAQGVQYERAEVVRAGVGALSHKLLRAAVLLVNALPEPGSQSDNAVDDGPLSPLAAANDEASESVLARMRRLDRYMHRLMSATNRLGSDDPREARALARASGDATLGSALRGIEHANEHACDVMLARRAEQSAAIDALLVRLLRAAGCNVQQLPGEVALPDAQGRMVRCAVRMAVGVSEADAQGRTIVLVDAPDASESELVQGIECAADASLRWASPEQVTAARREIFG